MNAIRWARAALVCLAVGMAGLHHDPAAAQGYPNHPIRMVVGFAAGGNTDLVARMLAEQLTTRLGQAVVVENRAGAGGSLAGAYVAKSPADGYTLLFASNSHAINAVLYKQLPYDTINGFQPIAPVAVTVKVLAVSPKLPVRNVKEFIAYAKAHPGAVSMASAGVGSSAHFAGVLFNTMAGIETTHVPYKGTADVLRDLMAGEVHYTVDSITAYIPLIKTGQVKALGVSSAKRTPLLPDVPTIGEAGLPGFELSDWVGVLGPAGMPPEVVAKLNTTINEVLKSPDIIRKLAEMGASPQHETPESFSKLIAADIDRFEKLRQAAHIEKQ